MTSDNALMIAKVALLTKELTLARIELKKKDQIIEKAEKVIEFYASPHSWIHLGSHGGSNTSGCFRIDICDRDETPKNKITGGKRARQYFNDKQKDEVKEGK